MKVGVTLPQFQPSPEPAIAAAKQAEAAGLDGVFVFDHIWAIGQPDRPALNSWPLLGALAAETEGVVLGTLVARIGLLANAVLEHNFESVRRMTGTDRLIAGLGTGDKLSKAENDAVDVPFLPVAERLPQLADAARRTRALGLTTWIGGTSPPVRDLARAEADALNLWGVDVAEIAAERDGEVTWGGVVPKNAAETADLLRRLAEAGATWAVCGGPVEIVAEAAAALH